MDPTNPLPARLRVVIDDREPRPGLADAAAALWPHVVVGRLPAGDAEIGPRVLVERKTVADFVVSLEDGRLFRQATALCAAAPRPLLVVEGEDPWDLARVGPRGIRGVLLSLLLDFRLPVVRTSSVEETAEWIAHVAWREERRLAESAARDAKRDRSRGRTEAAPGRVAMDLLGSIPGVGDLRARRLVETFGTAGAVARADERRLRDVAGIGPRTAASIRSAFEGDPPGPSGDDDDHGGADAVRERPPRWVRAPARATAAP